MTGMKELKKELAKYIAANVCGMIGLSCYILADTFFIANAIGANGLTALNLALPIYSMVHGSGLMLGWEVQPDFRLPEDRISKGWRIRFFPRP